MAEWNKFSLGEVTVNYDSRRVPVKAGERTAGPYPYYGASGVVDYVGDYVFDGDYLLVAEDGDNIRTRKTPIAFMATGRFWVNNHAHIVKANDLANSWYLSYVLRETDLSGYISGSTRPKITKHALNSIQVVLPGRPYQDAVVAVLSALDDKVAVNERVASASEELLHCIFISHIASHSTRSLPLSSFAEFINGRAFTKDASGSGRMVVRIAEINSGPSGSTVYNDVDVHESHLARPGDILFAWSGSLTVARWFRCEAIVNQHIFKVVPRSDVPQWLAFELTRSKLNEFRGVAADKATTMGHIQRSHLDEEVVAPDAGAVSRLDAELAPLWERALAAEQESESLAQLRDTLLPKLMSGEIRVRDAEKAVEEAT